jgi:putative ABC transport system permease protein
VVDSDKNSSSIDYNLNDILKNNYASVQNSCPLEIQPGINADTYASNHEPCYVKGLISTSNRFFEMFDIELIRCVDRTKPFLDKRSSIITESVARKIFGDTDPLGKALKVSHMQTVVSAIVKDFKPNTCINGQIMLNAENKDFRLNTNWANDEIFSTTNHFILLREAHLKVGLEQDINESLANFTKQHKTIFLQPLANIYLDSSITDNFKHGSKTLLFILIVIGSLILSLSVVNYVNYSLALQVKRFTEVNIRRTNGAGKRDLFGGFLTDTTTWILIAFSLSILFTAMIIPVFNNLLQISLNIDALFKMPVIFGVTSALIIVTFISALPILTMLSKLNMAGFLKNNLQKGQQIKRLTFLTVFQLVVSIFLIVVLIGISNQVNFVKQKDLGFNDDALLHISIPYKALNEKSFKDKLLAHSSIESASLSAGIPGNISRKMSNHEWNYTLHFIDIDADFLSTMEIKLLQGRTLLPKEKGACLVNEATLKTLEITDYRTTEVNGNEIVGVVSDFNFSSLHQEIQPIILEAGEGRDLSVRIRKGEIIGAMAYIKAVWKDMAPETSLEYEFYELRFDSMYNKEEQLGNAISVFAFVALIITCLGLLSQVFQITNSRTKEIGIRKVNGARISEVLVMLNKDFVKWVAIAFVIATPIAWYAMNQWLQNFAYKTELSWWIFALAGLVALGIALLTVSWQSWRAARRNPVEALRYE